MIPPILFSYHYLRKQVAFATACRDIVGGRHAEVLIDSGAFSVHRLGKEIPLEEYVEFIKALEALGPIYGAIQLDVIGNSEGTARNLARMVELGVRPMPVLTTDMDVGMMPSLVQINPRICVAGGVSQFQGTENWIKRRYLAAHEASGGEARIHGLGYVKWPEMLQLPLASVDSSSFSASARFGLISWFEASERYESVIHMKGWRDMAERPWSKVPPGVRDLILRCGITPTEWHDEQVMTRSEGCFAWMSGVYAYVLQSIVAGRRGLRVFTAIGGISMLKLYLSVVANLNVGLDGFDFHAAREDMRCDFYNMEDPTARLDLIRRASERTDLVSKAAIRKTLV